MNPAQLRVHIEAYLDFLEANVDGLTLENVAKARKRLTGQT